MVLVGAGLVICKNVLKAIWRVSRDMGTGCVRWEDEYMMQGRLGLPGIVSLHAQDLLASDRSGLVADCSHLLWMYSITCP